MDPSNGPEIPIPTAEWLLDSKRELKAQLSQWRLLICNAELPSGLLMLANLLDTPAGEPPLRLLGLCRQSSEVASLLPDPANDVLVLCQDFLRDGPALPMLRQLLRQSAPPTVLLSLGTPHRVAIRSALAAGVQGLISQETVGRGGVLEALHHLCAGQTFIDPVCRAVLEDTSTASSELSAREVEVLALVAEGCSNRAIAAQLQIAEVTARDHVQRILSKLQVADRAAAAVTGLRLGYLS
jgi:DNA-binding NarL/FixJ family response regulator